MPTTQAARTAQSRPNAWHGVALAWVLLVSAGLSCYPHRSAMLYPADWSAFCASHPDCLGVRSVGVTYPARAPSHARVTFIVKPDGATAGELGAAANAWQQARLGWLGRWLYVPAVARVERQRATPSWVPKPRPFPTTQDT